MDISNFSTLLAVWPTDWIIIGAFAAIVAIDSLRAGSSRATALSLALPLAVVAFSSLSQTAYLSPLVPQLTTPLAQAITFGAIAAVLFFIIHRVLGMWGDASEGPMQALIAGVACAVITILVWLQIPALETVWHFGGQVQAIFGASYRLLWLIGSLAALAYVRS